MAYYSFKQNDVDYQEIIDREAVKLGNMTDRYAARLQRAADKVAGAPRNEREELIGKFLEKLNPARTTAGYRAMSYPRVARMLQHITSNSDLHAFYKQCSNARSFGAYFNWALKPQSHPGLKPKTP